MIRLILGIIGIVLAAFFGFTNEDIGELTSSKGFETNKSNEVAGFERCKVLRVFDGDTLACDLNNDGRDQKPEEHIRLLGIDTPETRHSAKARRRQGASYEDAVDEPYAKESGEYLRSRTQGKRVWLERDTVTHDKYGRSLAFVYAEQPIGNNQPQASLNAQLLQHGLAATLFIGKNRRYERDFEQYEADARKQHLGIWKP